MRVIFVGASTTARVAAEQALAQGHEAVIVEKDEALIDALSDEFDCSFIHADGSRPATLEALSPDNSDMLYCLTDRDHDNIIAGLVARSLGFERVVVRIDDADLEPICAELGLKDVMIPSRQIGQSLIDLLEGRESPELSSVLRGGWRFWGFTTGNEPSGRLDALELPARARAIALTRDDQTLLADPELEIEPGDYILLLVHGDELDALCDRYESS